MGISTDGQLNFGVLLAQEQDLPWEGHYRYDENDNEEYVEGLGFEDWYHKQVLGFEHSFEIWSDELDERGRLQYRPEIGEKEKDFYYQEWWDFQESNPVPFDLVYYCSYDYPTYMLSVGPGWKCYMGQAVPVDPREMTVSKQDTQKLLDFCEDHGIKTLGEPNWHLTSLMG